MSDAANGETVIISIMISILLGAAAIAPAYVVWTTVPTVSAAGEWGVLVRLGAAIVTAVVGAFVGGYLLKTSVETARSLESGGEVDE